MPRIFLSYSWESDSHRDWVRELANDLMKSGIEVHLDQWDIKPGESVTAFMEQEVTKADYVIAVCTPTFASKSEKRSGGVGYEQQIVSGALLSGTPRSKFIPIIRLGDLNGENRAIPLHFGGTFFLDFRDDSRYADSLEQLIRALFQSPKYQRPVIGKPPEYLHAEKTLPESNNILHVRLNQQYCLENTEVELLAYEIARIINSGNTPEFTFYSPGYSDEKSELLQSKEISPQRKLELLRVVEANKMYGQDRDTILTESMMLLINYVYPQLGLLSSPSLASKTIAKVIESNSPYNRDATHGRKFDVFTDDWSFGIDLSTEEVQQLERSEDTEVMYLVASWGLRIGHLDPRIIREKVAPKMIEEFFWNKYRWKKTPDPVKFFDFKNWQVGLG